MIRWVACTTLAAGLSLCDEFRATLKDPLGRLRYPEISISVIYC